MSWNSYRMLFIYGLSMALFITLGFTNQGTNNMRVETQSIPSTFPEFIQHSDPSPLLSYAAQMRIQDTLNISTVEKEIPKQHNEMVMASYISTKPAVTTTEVTKPTYEVTVPKYEITTAFLNVRTAPSVKSKIITVIKQGDILEVIEVKKNGWLAIKGGGYIHGGYAQEVKMNHKITEVVSKPIVEPQELVGSMLPPVIDIMLEPGKPTSKVKSESGLNEEHISTIFKGTALEDEGLEEVILAIEQEYGINAFFTIAVLKLESGNGESKLAEKKNNLFGLNAIDGDAHRSAFSFKTKGDSVRKFGQLISKNYIGKGYTTIEKVAKKYCPSNEKWPALVTTIMKSDYKKL
jgi:hypothetical protein